MKSATLRHKKIPTHPRHTHRRINKVKKTLKDQNQVTFRKREQKAEHSRMVATESPPKAPHERSNVKQTSRLRHHTKNKSNEATEQTKQRKKITQQIPRTHSFSYKHY